MTSYGHRSSRYCQPRGHTRKVGGRGPLTAGNERHLQRTGPDPTDRGKSGTKRSLLTEGHGVPPGNGCGGSESARYDIGTADPEAMVIERPELTADKPQNFCMGKGYDIPLAGQVRTQQTAQPAPVLVTVGQVQEPLYLLVERDLHLFIAIYEANLLLRKYLRSDAAPGSRK